MKPPRSVWMGAGLVLGAAALALAQSFPGIPNANQIFAGPPSGSPGPGRFRSMVSADVPAGILSNSNFAAMTQNAVKGAATSTAATDLLLPSCSATNSALEWTANSGFNCINDAARLTIADQILSGGANVTSLGLGTISTGTTTIDCGARPTQFYTNNGAHTLAAPVNDGSCVVLVTNGASAGAITFSGFSVGANTGDLLTTTNTQKFSISIWRINGTAGYRVAAHQ